MKFKSMKNFLLAMNSYSRSRASGILINIYLFDFCRRWQKSVLVASCWLVLAGCQSIQALDVVPAPGTAVESDGLDESPATSLEAGPGGGSGAPKIGKPAGARVQGKVPSEELRAIRQRIEEFRDSAFVEVKVRKTVESPYMTLPKSANGTLALAKGRLRLRMESPENTLLVLTRNDLWLESRPDVEGDWPVQVTHFKTRTMKGSNVFLAGLFEDKAIFQEMRVGSHKHTDAGEEYDLVPRPQSKEKEIKSVWLFFKSGEGLKQLRYEDQLGNKISFEFLSLAKRNNVPRQLFEYQPPKGAEVTRM